MFPDVRLYQPLNAALGLAGFGRLRGLQVIKAAPGVAVQYEESRILALQCIQAVEQRNVLGDVREISGMVDVLVVHRGGHCACMRGGAGGNS